jgi:hemolysin III
MAITDEAPIGGPAPVPKPSMRGLFHLAAFPVAVVSGLVLVVVADGRRDVIGASVYALACVVLFGCSALYHRGSWDPITRARLRRLDHANIFVQIAGTYTPLCLALLSGNARVVVLSVVWIGAVAGIVFRLVWMSAPPWVYTPFYLALGWVAIGVLPQLWSEGGAAIGWLIVAGGAAYTVGGVVYARRRPDPAPLTFGYHEIFHVCTLVGFACHYAAVALALG